MKNIILSLLLTIGLQSFGQPSDSNNSNGTLGDDQRMNLDAPTSDRFVLPQNLVWPVNIGEADVCLWNDDKLAATTITIDDNIEGDHSWWLSMQEKYDLEFTWFAIVGKVSKWSKYQKLIDAGHEVQTHDLAIAPAIHGDVNGYSDEDYLTTITKARDTINKMLTENNSLTFAYPYGEQKGYLSRSEFIAMRGVTGYMNHANRINYLDINSRSATNKVEDIRVLLDPTKDLDGWGSAHIYYRGLASYHYHQVFYGAARTKTEAFLAAISEKSDSIWNGKFSEVTRYGQERDTHTLTVDEIADNDIKFTLTDLMDDNYFDFPLTVKIRVDNAWKGVKAFQNGISVDAKIINNEGNMYVLVKAVPDKGQVTISKSDALSKIDFIRKVISVYPNPVSGSVINVQLSDNHIGNQNIELISISGKIVYSSVINKGITDHRINLADQLNQGIYLLRVSDNYSVTTKRVIIN